MYKASDKNNRKLNQLSTMPFLRGLNEIHLQNHKFTRSNERWDATLAKVDRVNERWDATLVKVDRVFCNAE